MKPNKLLFLYTILLLAVFIVPAVANEQNTDMGNMDMGTAPSSDHIATTSESAHSMGGQVNWLVIALFLLAIVALGYVAFNTEKLKENKFP